MPLLTTLIGGNGGGPTVKHARSALTNVAGASLVDITVTWPEAFPDTNYTSPFSVQGPNISIVIPKWYLKTKTASSITVRVENVALTAQDFIVHAVGIAD